MFQDKRAYSLFVIVFLCLFGTVSFSSGQDDPISTSNVSYIRGKKRETKITIYATIIPETGTLPLIMNSSSFDNVKTYYKGASGSEWKSVDAVEVGRHVYRANIPLSDIGDEFKMLFAPGSIAEMPDDYSCPAHPCPKSWTSTEKNENDAGFLSGFGVAGYDGKVLRLYLDNPRAADFQFVVTLPFVLTQGGSGSRDYATSINSGDPCNVERNLLSNTPEAWEKTKSDAPRTLRETIPAYYACGDGGMNYFDFNVGSFRNPLTKGFLSFSFAPGHTPRGASFRNQYIPGLRVVFRYHVCTINKDDSVACRTVYH